MATVRGTALPFGFKARPDGARTAQVTFGGTGQWVDVVASTLADMGLYESVETVYVRNASAVPVQLKSYGTGQIITVPPFTEGYWTVLGSPTAFGWQGSAASTASFDAWFCTAAISPEIWSMNGAGVGYSGWSAGQVSVTNVATLVVAARATRGAVVITNMGTTAVYLGPTNAVTAATGEFLAGVVGASKTLSWVGDVYGIVAAGSQTVSYGEYY